MRTHYVVLGGFVLTVLCAVALGIADGGPDGPVRVEKSNGIKFLVDPMYRDGGPKTGMGISGFLAIDRNNCVALRAPRSRDYGSVVVWPKRTRILAHKAWLSVDTRFGDFPLEGDLYGGGGYYLRPNRLPAEVVAACPADRYLFVDEFGLVEVVR